MEALANALEGDMPTLNDGPAGRRSIPASYAMDGSCQELAGQSGLIEAIVSRAARQRSFASFRMAVVSAERPPWM